MNVPVAWLVFGGGALLVIGGSAAFGFALRPSGPLGKLITRYIARLDGECRFQCYSIDGRQFFARQVAGLILAVIACVAIEERMLWILPVLLIPGPWFVLRRLRKKRIERIEAQLDGWLLVLSNMLKTTGGLSDALAASIDLVRAPLRQELDQVLKEVRLGATLDDALRQTAERVRSSTLAAVVTILLVGRRTGGELPGLLESAAAALREMARLEGVIRSKTAEGKIQVLVLGCAPIAAFFGFRMMDPNFFDPLFGSLLGYCVLGAGVALWLLALYSARKILNVDY
ncbi:MAG TPA: type II secretion system F family protein [Kofleriaceae bacterium]|nr:type II secretion system F family protein [Kofleriaceae bacterium]